MTGVSVAALRGSRSLSDFSINERMSWAQRRETKREEDAAYCLLGLFNIYMSPIYGEGKENALKRLRKEIHGDGACDLILKRLNPPDYAMIYRESLEEREDSTGRWIFRHPLFSKWLNGPDLTGTKRCLLWIHGNPGVGKTTLAASVIQSLSKQWRSTRSGPGMFYYFFSHEDPINTRPISACRSMLAQLLHKHHDNEFLANEVISAIKNGPSGSSQEHFSEAEVMHLLEICFHSIGSTFIILDGVDECTKIKSLLKVIEMLIKSSTVKILIFSRPNVHELVRFVPEICRLDFSQDEVDEDIRLYLNRNLEDMAKEDQLLPEANISSYVEHLVVGADKMFLWAKLMVSYLQSPVLTPSAIEKLIWNIRLPEGLENMYDRIFDLIGQSPRHQQALATRILSWIIYGRRKLGTDDLQIVIGPASEDKDTMFETLSNFVELVSVITGGLVTNQGTDEFPACSLIHLSAHEYLVQWKPSKTILSSTDLLRPAAISSNLQITATALRLLLKAGRRRQFPNEVGNKTHRSSLVSYAAINWINHLDSTVTYSPSSVWDRDRACRNFEKLQNVLSEFLASPYAVAIFVGSFYETQSKSQLFLADEFSLSRQLRTILNWIEWMQMPTYLDSSVQTLQSTQTTLMTLRAFYHEMTTLDDQWGAKLLKNPSLIWGDALIFCSSRFLPQSDLASTTSFIPKSSTIPATSSRPLCHISATSKDTNLMGILSIWPSDQELVFEVTLSLEALEIALQMRQAFRHEHNETWKASFPITISPDGCTLAILRTLYQFSRSSFGSTLRWKATVLPLHLMDDVRQKWESNLGIFDPNRPVVKDLPPSLRLIVRDWYTYTFTFSSDCKYLVFSDHQSPFCRHLILFEVLTDRRTGVNLISSTSLHIAKAELKFTTFHDTLPLVAFVCLNRAYVWNFRATGNATPSQIEWSQQSTGRSSGIIGMCFSSCGKYILVTLEQGSEVISLDTYGFGTDTERINLLTDAQIAESESSTQIRTQDFRALEAVSGANISQNTVALTSGMQSALFEQGSALSVTTQGQVRLRTSQLVQSTLLEEQANILELPLNAGSSQAVLKRHPLQTHTGEGKLSIIFNKTAQDGYDMNEQNTEMFPMIVDKHYASIDTTQTSRLLEPKMGLQELGLKRPCDSRETVESLYKLQRTGDHPTASSQNILATRPRERTGARSGLAICDLIHGPSQSLDD
ncbi:hypothetical protein BKA66DRAFT_571316 [Pyrenochaeta sp. MPI-SDFR-AT-0127]|nr:hypothetical protein BKA66DRAFT_571316 [Pyrenochaeta sp. MPI-SDFR-AT-0127]